MLNEREHMGRAGDGRRRACEVVSTANRDQSELHTQHSRLNSADHGEDDQGAAYRSEEPVVAVVRPLMRGTAHIGDLRSEAGEKGHQCVSTNR
jgi:hypothetical protein